MPRPVKRIDLIRLDHVLGKMREHDHHEDLQAAPMPHAIEPRHERWSGPRVTHLRFLNRDGSMPWFRARGIRRNGGTGLAPRPPEYRPKVLHVTPDARLTDRASQGTRRV